MSRIFEWVSDSLRDPARTYELITPARRPLVTSAGTLRQADLLPSSLLNFRCAAHRWLVMLSFLSCTAALRECVWFIWDIPNPVVVGVAAAIP